MYATSAFVPHSLLACEDGIPGSALRAFSGRCSLIMYLSACRTTIDTYRTIAMRGGNRGAAVTAVTGARE